MNYSVKHRENFVNGEALNEVKLCVTNSCNSFKFVQFVFIK